MSAGFLLTISICSFLATVFQSIAGFGYAIIGIPIMSIFLDPRECVFFFMVSGFYMRVLTNIDLRHEIKFSRIKYILAGAVVGAIPGILVLRLLNANVLRIILGITLLLAVTLLYSNFHWETKNAKKEELLCGLVSGFFHGTTSVSGPPVAVYLLHKGTPKAQMRADMAFYFLLMSGWALLVALAIGTIKPGYLLGIPLYTLPCCVLGIWVGNRIFNRINQQMFRKIVFVAIIMGACNMLYKGFTGL